ncbi:MAG: hypothetical protein WCC12_22040 [Anaerolineales bacterium]
MNDAPDPFAFPDLNDEAVIALNDFLEEFYTRFQNHYFAQMHRFVAGLSRPDLYNDQMALPLDDPPF